MKERYWKYSLIVFILGLGYLLFRQAQPFMNGILGGFTLYLLLRNFTFWLQTKMKPALAVWLVTIGVTLFILIPLSLFSWALVSQVSKMHFDTEAIIRPAWHVIDFVKDRTGFDILSEKSLSFFVSQASSIGQSVMSGVSDLLVNLCVQLVSDYKGKNIIIRRLRRQQLLGAMLLVLTGVIMLLWKRNEWIVCLTVAAVLELYTAFRIPQEEAKEN
jgi:predicted PurR-regulated permease PerM